MVPGIIAGRFVICYLHYGETYPVKIQCILLREGHPGISIPSGAPIAVVERYQVYF